MEDVYVATMEISNDHTPDKSKVNGGLRVGESRSTNMFDTLCGTTRQNPQLTDMSGWG